MATYTNTSRFLRPSSISPTPWHAGRLPAVNRKPPSTRKKVVIHKLDSGLVKGYVDPQKYLGQTAVEMIDQEGRLLTMPLEEIKGVFFVRDFEGDRNRQERKVFRSRPKLSGLWIRMTFKDQEVLEGLISNNLLEINPVGFAVTPPDVYSNNLRIFVPRSALQAMHVLGVISDGSARRVSQRAGEAPRRPRDTSAQLGLFSSSSPVEAE